jgi:lysophospholipase L1-like esterase
MTIKKHVLCYGDSLSWGIIPGTRQRHPFEQRWTGIVQGLLGPEVRVIEECLNGRTTAWEDPQRPGRHGGAYLPQILQTHAPFDAVVLFLGTNDMQAVFDASAEDSARGVEALVAAIQSARPEPMTVAPAILLVAPPRIGRPAGAMEEKFRGAGGKSLGFLDAYRAVAERHACGLCDAAIVLPGDVDGVHWDEGQHAQFARAVAPALSAMLAGRSD